MGSFGRWSAYSSFGQTIRLLFLSTNLLSLLLLLATLLYGGWVYQTRTKYSELLSPSMYVDVSKIMFIVSGLGIVNGLIAVYSVMKELRCLIYSFVTASLIICFMLLIGGIMGFAFRTKLTQTPLHLKMLTSLKELYGSEDMKEITTAWDELQTNFHCCGVNGTDNFKLWRTSKWHMHHLEPKPIVPASCLIHSCKENMLEICSKMNAFPNNQEANNYVYTDTCYMTLRTNLLAVMHVAAWLLVITSIIMLFPAFFAGTYARLIRK